MARVSVVLLLIAIFPSYFAAHLPLPSNDLSLTSFVDFDSSLEWQEFRIKFADVDIPYNISVPSTNVCNGVSIFGFVPSNPVLANVRSAMRDSWMNKSPNSVLFRFIMGRPSQPEMYAKMLEEQKQFGDIIFFDVQDTYKLLYLKVYAGFQWQQAFCPNVKFVVKVDDDVVMALHRLDYWVTKEFESILQKHKSIVFGVPRLGNAFLIPNRNKKSKYYVSVEEYAKTWYPPYMAGSMYMMSNEAVSAILDKAPEENGLSTEDVLYTGVLAQNAGVYQQDFSKHYRLGNFPHNGRCKDSGKTPMPFAACCYHNPEIFQMIHQDLISFHC